PVCISSMTIAPYYFALASGQPKQFCIGPGDSAKVHLVTTIDTFGRPAANLTTLRIESDADQPLAPIALAREISYPVSWQLSFDAADSTKPGGIAVYHVLQNTTLPKDDSSIDFTIS